MLKAKPLLVLPFLAPDIIPIVFPNELQGILKYTMVNADIQSKVALECNEQNYHFD